MKKYHIFFLILLLIVAGIASLLYLRLAPQEQFDIQKELVNEPTPAQEVVKEIAQQLESPEKNLAIPDEIYEELSVTDIDVRTESIANQPDLWRAFFNAPVNHSDSSFAFGCLYYLDTGGRLILDVFTDQAGNTWVAEATANRLIGIGLVEEAVYKKMANYFEVNPEVACLEVTRRNYATYKLMTSEVELRHEFDQYFLLSGDISLPFPEDLYYSFSEARDAILLGDSVLYLGYDGIEVFDLQHWEASLLYEFLWKDLHGISNFVQPAESTDRIAIGIQTWDEEWAYVIAYEYSQEEGVYELGKSTADLAWQIGVSGIPNLEFPQDLSFIDAKTLQIIEYPEFNEKIVSGDFPPDAGEMQVQTWELE